ncbi:unnamed protein product, partial [Darwinula stevensoni]
MTFPIPGIPDFTLAIFIVTGLVSVICILGYLRVILAGGVGKNGSTVAIWATVDSMRYCSFVCIEICDHMNIYLFKITPSLSPQDGSRNHASEGSDSVPVSSSWGNTSPSTSPPRTRSRSKQIPTHTDVHQ